MSDVVTNVYGVTTAGFVIKPLQQIVSELGQAAQTTWGANVDLAPDGPIGQMIGNESNKFYQLWQLAQAVYNSISPDGATGISLDRVAALVGVKRLSAQATQVTECLFGTPGVNVPLGHVISQSAAGYSFSLQSAVTIALSSLVSIQLTVATAINGHTYSLYVNSYYVAYTAGPSDTTATIAAALVAGINALAIPTLTVTYTGGNAFWSMVANDGATAFAITSLDPNITYASVGSPGLYYCTTTGPIPAPTGSVDTISTPVTGLSSVTNLAAGTIGTNAESDSSFRVRRYVALYGGSSTDAAIASSAMTVAGVTYALTTSNRTLSTDGLGRPPKSFECVVLGGVSQSVAQAIFNAMPSGIQPYGNTGPFTVLDAGGNPQTVYFSRPVNQYIWITVGVNRIGGGGGSFPPNGASLIQNVIMAWANANMSLTSTPNPPPIGKSVYWAVILAAIMTSTIPGIDNVTVQLAVTSTPSPPGNYAVQDIPITVQQIPIFASGQITVNILT